MKNGLIVEFYLNAKKTLLNRLSLFIESPYYNKQDVVKKLHYYLVKQHPDFKESLCTNEKVYAALFDKQAFKLQKLKDIKFNLQGIIEQFIVAEELKNNSPQYRRIEIQALQKTSNSRLTKKVLNKTFQELKREDSNSFLYHQFRLNDFAYNIEETIGDRIQSPIYLQAYSDYLDQYYFSKKMMIGAAMLNRQKVLNTDFTMSFFDETSAFISSNTKTDIAVALNHSLFLLLKTEEDSHYYFIKENIPDKLVSDEEKSTYISFLRNYCIGKINGGNSSFLTELFDINLLLIQEKLILYNDKISEWTYKNFITVGIRLKKYQWTRQFIENYSQYLNTSNYENAYNYNMANLHYAEKNYKDAMHLLLNVDYTDVIYLLDSKALLLKIYFEEEEFDASESLLHSFRLLSMRQKKISAKKKKSFLNLIKITDKILKLKRKKSTLKEIDFLASLAKIKKYIENANSLANKTWLLEKWKELSN